MESKRTEKGVRSSRNSSKAAAAAKRTHHQEQEAFRCTHPYGKNRSI